MGCVPCDIPKAFLLCGSWLFNQENLLADLFAGRVSVTLPVISGHSCSSWEGRGGGRGRGVLFKSSSVVEDDI